jgi:hypothetical protein
MFPHCDFFCAEKCASDPRQTQPTTAAGTINPKCSETLYCCERPLFTGDKGSDSPISNIILKLRILVLLPVSTLPCVVKDKVKNYS